MYHEQNVIWLLTVTADIQSHGTDLVATPGYMVSWWQGELALYPVFPQGDSSDRTLALTICPRPRLSTLLFGELTFSVPNGEASGKVPKRRMGEMEG